MGEISSERGKKAGSGPNGGYIRLLVLGVQGGNRETTELIVFGQDRSEWGIGYYAVDRVFEKRHPGVKIVAPPTPHATLRLLTSIVGKASPDVITLSASKSGSCTEWAARGALMPLDQFIRRDCKDRYAIRPEDYYQSAWESVTYQGEVQPFSPLRVSLGTFP